MKIFVYSILTLFLFISLFPTFMMFITSFVPEGDLFNRTVVKTVTDFEVPRTVLLNRVRPLNTNLNLFKEKNNTFFRLEAKVDFSGIAPSLGSSDINRIKYIQFRIRNQDPMILRIGFKDIRERIEYFTERILEANADWEKSMSSWM